ncbi:unnamed protein product [Meloidogyne enterolobii]|uniref:Uncharacterized protein n=1 Tax=Meloidogyne enterolobii TaxID=390850 RepID=A0ACB0YYE1_MELEN
MRVENNCEVDILSRLGILERETPNDNLTTKIKSNRFVDKKRKFHRVSLNVALNKISLSESSTDEDKDFINKTSSSETKNDQTIFYSSNNNCHSNPNFCEFISLLSAAGFLILINSIFILLGSYFATFSLFKFNLNSFFLLLSVMLTFVTIFALFLIDKSEKILNFGHLSIILFNASQSFLIATIERVILLIIPRWKINFGRVIFIVYSFIAFCAFLSSSLQINLEKNNLSNNSEINEKQIKILNKTENLLEEFIFIKYLFFNEFLFILLIFVLPILFGFCCFLGQPLGSPQQKISKNNYFNELQVSSSFICQILLFFIMTLHFTSSFIAQHSIYFNKENNFENVQNVLFWLFLLIFRLPFVFWPNLSIRSNLFYFLYFILITASILLKLIIPEHFSNIFDLAILSFSSNFPLFLYVWYINYSKCSHLDISFCFILSLSFGELIGKFIFWKQNISPSLSFKIGLFSITFLLFLILFFKIQKEGRQRQIIEYRSSINGNTQNSSKIKKKLKKKVKTSKGAYSLLEMNRRIANKNNTEKQQKTLISSNDDRSSFDSEDDEDEADVEMESVTGDYDEELEKEEECKKINELL